MGPDCEINKHGYMTISCLLPTHLVSLPPGCCVNHLHVFYIAYYRETERKNKIKLQVSKHI